MLLSIQALILVEEPFFNEPGFEKQAGQGEGQVRTRVRWAVVVRTHKRETAQATRCEPIWRCVVR